MFKKIFELQSSIGSSHVISTTNYCTSLIHLNTADELFWGIRTILGRWRSRAGCYDRAFPIFSNKLEAAQ